MHNRSKKTSPDTGSDAKERRKASENNNTNLIQ